MDPVLDLRGLRVEVGRGAAIVEDVSFEVARGEILGLVGESGSGKTTTALAMLGFAAPGTRIVRGSVKVAGHQLIGLPERELRKLRGRYVSYIPQDPSTALNPALRVEDQIAEVLRAHFPNRDEKAEIARALERVRLSSAASMRRRFPHQLSGGQKQRVAIAIALVAEPPVVVLDEPTTGLDVVTQAFILNEIDRLRRELDVALVYISHNLAVVGSLADRIAVMYAGWVVEEGPTREILEDPRHPYSRGLVASVPDHLNPRRIRGIPGVALGVGSARPRGCPFAPRCAQKPPRAELEMPPREVVAADRFVRCFEWRSTPSLAVGGDYEALGAAPAGQDDLLVVDHLRAEYRGRRDLVVAVDDVSFRLGRAESLGLVGESGSGKTTIGRCIVGLHAPTGGDLLLDGVPLAPLSIKRGRTERRRIQIVFQDPHESLNPRTLVGEAIARPAYLLRGLSNQAAAAEAALLLEQVRLPARLAARYPRELSGGERQRIAIARALAAGPEILICDEVTSSLDVSVQAAIVELLAELRRDLGLSLLFISHDLGVVSGVAEQLLVLKDGRVEEYGEARQVIDRPSQQYTGVLISSAPRLGGRRDPTLLVT